MNSHSQRKHDHVSICLQHDIEHKASSGFDAYSFTHHALPELNFEEIDLSVQLFGRIFSLPLFISGMTGGYRDAIDINGALAEVCCELSIPLVLGSQRSMLHDDHSASTFTIARERGSNICISANIGATEIAQSIHQDGIIRIIDTINADWITIHANPLQELFQPEGNTDFRGVLKGIEDCRKRIQIPMIVKEVGSGISLDIAKRLHDIGIDGIDVAGKGGTSWSAVEMKRNEKEHSDYFKEWGMETSDCLLSLREFCENNHLTLLSSGGIRNAHDIAMSVAMGAKSVGMARPILIAYHEGGIRQVKMLIEQFMKDVQRIMFLTGSKNCNDLSQAQFKMNQRN